MTLNKIKHQGKPKTPSEQISSIASTMAAHRRRAPANSRIRLFIINWRAIAISTLALSLAILIRGASSALPRPPPLTSQSGLLSAQPSSADLYQQFYAMANNETPPSSSASSIDLLSPAIGDNSILPLGSTPAASVPSSGQPDSASTHQSAPLLSLSSSQSAAQQQQQPNGLSCPTGLLTFELSTGFIYKPASAETLAMLPSTLQLTDCLNSCLQNQSCLAINFEMGLCVLLSSSAAQNPSNLYSSQFPVFVIYAEKKCLLSSANEKGRAKQRRCQRAWTFERVAGYELRTKPRRKLAKVQSKELCMEACLLSADFECRSANWYRQTGECTLSDQDRHSVSQVEAGDQRIKSSLADLYGPASQQQPQPALARLRPPSSQAANGGGSSGKQRRPPLGLYQNYFNGGQQRTAPLLPGKYSRLNEQLTNGLVQDSKLQLQLQLREQRQFHGPMEQAAAAGANESAASNELQPDDFQLAGQQLDGLEPAAALAPVDYLENNCVYEPNKLCEFRKIQNRILKTVDSIYQDVATLEECKQKCLNAPYRCYSFDYGDTSERVCRTSHLDQASLMSVREPYLEVVGAITYELASCFNVTIQCRAREMVAQVSSNRMFRGKIYVKSRPQSCQLDVRESLQFELAMRYHDESCDVKASSSNQLGVFSNDIIIQHHDRIVTTQDVGLSVYCQYDLGNRSITNSVDLAIERIDPAAAIESKTPNSSNSQQQQQQQVRPDQALTITSLATTVVRSPNVTMRITNMNGQPVSSATVGDRLALLFEIKEKTSPFGIFVREIIAMDGKQLMAAAAAAANKSTSQLTGASSIEQVEPNKANSVLFIDSLGCPTDANIMGPLIRMDPSGQRILAPFDAFKFPGSEMVFFRAVVSSCVSECKQAVCSSSQLSASSSSSSPVASDFELTGQPSGGGGGGDSNLMASTRNMQPARSTEIFSTYSTPAMSSSSGGSTIAITTLAPETSETRTTAAAAASSLSAITTPPSSVTNAATAAASTNQSKAPPSSGSGTTTIASPIGDSMTTIAGFQLANSDKQQQQQMNEDAAANFTNNHQSGADGKLPPRPASNSSSLANGANGAANQQLPAPVGLSSQQEQQLLKLFEQHLRASDLLNNQASGGQQQQQQMSDTKMAHLYMGWLKSMLDSSGGRAEMIKFLASALPSLSSPSPPLPDDELLKKAADGDGSGNGNWRAEASSRDQLVALMAHLLAKLDNKRAPIVSAASLEPPPSNGATNQPANGGAQLSPSSPSPPPSNNNKNNLNNPAGELQQVNSSVASMQPQSQSQTHSNLLMQTPMQPQLQTAQHFDRPTDLSMAGGGGGGPRGDSDAAAAAAAAAEAAVAAAIDLMAAEISLPHNNGNDQAAASSANNDVAGDAPPDGSKRKQKGHQQQPQSDGGGGAGTNRARLARRRRNLREANSDAGHLNQHVQLTQAQDSIYLDPLDGNSLPFRQSIVEMYHTTATTTGGRRNHQPTSQIQAAAAAIRGKRDLMLANELQQPADEELVVQSIKIVDRLKFADEEAPSGAAAAAAARPRAAAAAAASASRPRKASSQSQVLRKQQPDHHQQATTTTAKWSAFSLLVIGMLFLFAQTFLVLVCLLDWSGGGRSSGAGCRTEHAAPPVVDCRTLSAGSSAASIVGSLSPASFVSNNLSSGGCWLDSANCSAIRRQQQQQRHSLDDSCRRQTIIMGRREERRRPAASSLSASSVSSLLSIDERCYDRLDSYLIQLPPTTKPSLSGQPTSQRSNQHHHHHHHRHLHPAHRH